LKKLPPMKKSDAFPTTNEWKRIIRKRKDEGTLDPALHDKKPGWFSNNRVNPLVRAIIKEERGLDA